MDEDLASFETLQRYHERVFGVRVPQAALRHNWEATSTGAVGARRRFPGSETLMKGTRQFAAIPVPALIIFANPKSLGPWRENHPDASVRTSVKDFLARSEMLTRKQEIALRRAVPSARVVVLRGANHFVFISNEAEVMRELDAFIASMASVPVADGTSD